MITGVYRDILTANTPAVNNAGAVILIAGVSTTLALKIAGGAINIAPPAIFSAGGAMNITGEFTDRCG